MKCLIFLRRLDVSLQLLRSFGPGTRIARFVVAGPEQVALRVDLLLPSSQRVLRCDVARRAVQPGSLEVRSP